MRNRFFVPNFLFDFYSVRPMQLILADYPADMGCVLILNGFKFQVAPGTDFGQYSSSSCHRACATHNSPFLPQWWSKTSPVLIEPT